METREHLDMTKMAVAVMILALVLGTAISFFLLLYGKMGEKTSAFKSIGTTASAEKINSFRDMSKAAANGSGSYPLVSTVLGAFIEIENQDFMFYYVYEASNPSKRKVFVSGTVNATFVGGVSSSDIDVSVNYADECSRYMQQYIGYRCSVDYEEYSNGLYGVTIVVFTD